MLKAQQVVGKVHHSHFVDAGLEDQGRIDSWGCGIPGRDLPHALVGLPTLPSVWQVRGKDWAGMWILMGESLGASAIHLHAEGQGTCTPVRPGEPIDSRMHWLRALASWGQRIRLVAV